MGDEFVRKGSNVVLAPMLILARVPQDGRIFESIGEDPELAHDMAFAMISGVQSNVGVIANADDFVLNNQELDRGDVSSVCDRRTLFEGYYRGYAGAIEANVGSFMCSCALARRQLRGQLAHATDSAAPSHTIQLPTHHQTTALMERTLARTP